MNNPERQSKVLHLVIRVPKEESAFTYFQLEANEGLCFYSTLTSSLGQGYRDIDIVASLDFEQEVDHILEVLTEQFPIETIKREVLDDGPLVGRLED